MTTPVLLDDGRIQLASGRIIAVQHPLLSVQLEPNSFTTIRREKFGKIRLTTSDAEVGNLMWSITRDENFVIKVENGGSAIRLPRGSLMFPEPIQNVVQISEVVVVCLKTKVILGRWPTVAETVNPLVAFDSLG